MAITKQGGVITETPINDADRTERTGVYRDDSFAICSEHEPLKQIQFDATDLQDESKVIIKAPNASGTITVTLPATDTTLAGASNSFATIVPTAGTSPVADSATDTLTLASADGSVVITGTAASDSLDFATAANKTNQKVAVSKNSASVTGTRKQINLIEGANISLTVADNSGSDSIDVTIEAAGDAGGYMTVQEEGVDLTQRTKINFIGGGLTAADDVGNAATTVTIDADLSAIAGISSDGILARTGAGTASARTITAGSSKIAVTDGDGVSGNPTVDLGTVSIDHLSDVTITSAQTNDLLSYNGSAWVNTAPAATVNSFATINCPAGSDPVADSSTGTLNLTSTNTSILITGDSSTDTVNVDIDGANLPIVTLDSANDYLVIADASDSNKPKKALLGAVTATGFAWSGYFDSACHWERASATVGSMSANGTSNLTELYNSNFGTVTKASADDIGITFTCPSTGLYYVCAMPQTLGNAANIYWTLQLYDGTNILGHIAHRVNTAVDNMPMPFSISGIGSFTASNSYTINIRAAVTGGATVLIGQAGGSPYITGSRGYVDWFIFKVG